MSDNPRDRIADLRDGFDQDAQQFERAQAGATPVTASDTSGTVKVQLDEGGAIRTVTVADSWRAQVGIQNLPDAVLDAYTHAAAERARTWGAALDDGSGDPPSPVRPAPLTHTTVAGQVMELVNERPGAVNVEESVKALLEMVEDLDRGFDEVFAKVDGRLTAELTGNSSSRHVQVRVSGAGEILSVTFDERWLGFAHAFNVSRETTEAIHDGLRQVASSDPETLMNATSLGRLQRLVKDPEALADYLRLRD